MAIKMTKTISTIAAALLCATTLTHAGDDSTRATAVKAAARMAQDAFEYVGVTYICEAALGSSHLHAATIAVEGALMSAGKSQDDATIIVDDFIKSLKRDGVKKATASNSDQCLKKLLDAQSAFRVSQARFNKAAEADRR